MNNNYDIVVIGGGAGGLFAAIAAVSQKAKVCLIDKQRLGGDCTWNGCMPSKTLLKSAMIADLIKKRECYGLFSRSEIALETDKVMEHVRRVREEIGLHETPEIFEKKGMKVIIGLPRFTGANTININAQEITAKKFIIATGLHPMVPPIEGLKEIDYLTNETVFDLKKLPRSLIVLGGGPIGLELSQGLSRLGVEVSVVEMVGRVLLREDEEVARILEKRIRGEGIRLFTGKRAVKFEKEANLVNVHLEDKRGKEEKISAEKILVAVGRAPNVEGLGLENCGVQYTNKGIKVNEYLQTTNKNIFACGDIASPYQFSHVAAYTAYICVRNAMFRKIVWAKVNYSNVGWATFTDPELSCVGLTEEEARKKYKDIKVYKTEYSSADRSTTDLLKSGLLKVITDKKGLIVGAHIVGAQAGEIIQGLLIAKSLKIPLSKLAFVSYIYPTLSELIKKTAAKPLVESLRNPLLKLVIKMMRV